MKINFHFDGIIEIKFNVELDKGMKTITKKEITFPPASIVEMHAITLAVEQGELDLAMGRKSQAALTRMLDNPKIVSMNSITDLAKIMNVSPATLTRLSRLLGFTSFKSFQLVFRSELMGSSQFYSRQIKKSREDAETIDNLFSQARDNLSHMESQFDLNKLDAICKQLRTAKNIHVFGYRSNFMLSTFFTYGLGMIRQGVQLVNIASQGLAFSLGQIRDKDVLVGFSFHPYSSRTVKLMQQAQKMGIPMIVITDSLGSPIAKLSKNILLVPTASDFYSNSMVSACLLIEVILSRLAQTMGNKSIEQLEQRESLISQFNDEY
mgnify:CR=1 FL=1